MNIDAGRSNSHRDSNKFGESEATHEIYEWELGRKLANIEDRGSPCELVALQV